MQTCKRQALPMVWDFVESNPFSTSGICWPNCIKYTIQSLEVTACLKRQPGYSTQQDAKTQTISSNKIISTDPPYYNNIVYSDLSDFFYVWLRRILKPVYPQLFTSTMTPKSTELVATPYRHENQNAAEMFFMDGMTATMKQIAEQAHPAFPITIYYALKQSENNTEGTSSAGWESFLNAVINANLMIVGTWPVRTESAARLLSMDSNALASSIVLVCRPQTDNSRHCSRREFLRELNAVLPVALDEITNGGSDNFVAPVDLSQAIIGPGMAIYSKYSAVLEADGTKMSVKTALTLINRFLAEDDFDNDTQFCLAWFEMFGWDLKKTSEADADVLARAKGASVEGLASNGIVKRNTGNLRLLKWGELSLDWSPDDNSKISIWEILHHMIRRLNIDGEVGVALIFEKINSYSENVRSLAYRLFTICDRKGWAKDAGYYNSLIQSWERIELESRNVGNSETHKSLFEERK
ncbi:DUF1156 domain-containing protein [archaeon]|nr:DUF1156 domain-containing protein [archaeon]